MHDRWERCPVLQAGPDRKRRRFIAGLAAAPLAAVLRPPLAVAQGPLRFGLTPVFLNSDLELLARLKTYLERATGNPVKLITRRTYQEITSLLPNRRMASAANA